MLNSLNLTGFTVFADAALEFVPGLNVIVGENGTGKSQLLKAGYLVCSIHETFMTQRPNASKEAVEEHLAERLQNLYKVSSLTKLQRYKYVGETRLLAKLTGSLPTVAITAPNEIPQPMPEQGSWSFGIQKDVVRLDEPYGFKAANTHFADAVFIPSKEMLSFYDGFAALYKKREVSFDETFFDLANRLEINKLREQPELARKVLAMLEEVVGGKVQLEGGRFYIQVEDDYQQEITLLAEGLRKLATLIRLLENGSLQAGHTLFWDEPEANLNPKIIKLVARVIYILVTNGVQVVLGTHSLFLLRELEIIHLQESLPSFSQRYFGLALTADGVEVEQGDELTDLQHLVLLDEALQQTDRFMELG